MAPRTKTERAQIEVTPAVKSQLDSYKAALEKGFGRETSSSNLLGAMLSGIPLWQAEAMLSAYRSQGSSREDPGNDSDD